MTVGVSAANVATPWLNFLRGTNTSTAPSALYVKLHTGDPGTGASNAAAGSTTRVVVTLTASSAGSALAITGTNPSWTNGGTSETLTHISVWDASSSGNLLWTAALTSSQAWVSGNTFTLTSLGVAVSPQAA